MYNINNWFFSTTSMSIHGHSIQFIVIQDTSELFQIELAAVKACHMENEIDVQEDNNLLHERIITCTKACL